MKYPIGTIFYYNNNGVSDYCYAVSYNSFTLSYKIKWNKILCGAYFDYSETSITGGIKRKCWEIII
jgi:hypothetical protein